MLKEMQVVSMLGPCFGNIGTVLLAQRGSKLVALKKLDLERAEAKDLAAVQRELFLARQLQHKNLLPIESCFVDCYCLYVVSSVADYGSCADLVTNHFQGGLSEPVIALVLRDVLQALVYLHTRRILHRAVRGRHILVTSPGRALLTCLRYAEPYTPGATTHVFTAADSDNLNWLSPEVLAQDLDGYDQKSDIYSVGMACLELFNAAAPFSDVSPTCMLVQKLSGWVPAFTAFTREASPALAHVREICTRQDAELRPTAQQLLSLPFFKAKGDLRSLLHPVIPMAAHCVEANKDDLRAIMANSPKMADISIDHLDWNFD